MVIAIFKFENRTSDGEIFLPIGRDDSPVYFVLYASYNTSHSYFATILWLVIIGLLSINQGSSSRGTVGFGFLLWTQITSKVTPLKSLSTRVWWIADAKLHFMADGIFHLTSWRNVLPVKNSTEEIIIQHHSIYNVVFRPLALAILYVVTVYI